jgi:hypothetical protein
MMFLARRGPRHAGRLWPREPGINLVVSGMARMTVPLHPPRKKRCAIKKVEVVNDGGMIHGSPKASCRIPQFLHYILI